MADVKNSKAVSSVTVSGIKQVDVKPVKPVVIERKMSSENIGNEIASRVAGKLIDISDVYDVKTGLFLDESELKAKGCNFVSLSYKKDITKELLKKNRQTKEKTNFEQVVKTMKIVLLAEAKWQEFLEKYSTLDSLDGIVQDYRQNGVENFHCRTIGKTRQEKTTVNGIVFKTVEKTRYYDENDQEIDSNIMVDYLPKKDYTSMHKKYSIPENVKLPMYRTVRIDSCEWVRSFGFEFKPIDNLTK